MTSIGSMQRMCRVKLDRQRRQSDHDLRLILGHATILDAVNKQLLQQAAVQEYNRTCNRLSSIETQLASSSDVNQQDLQQSSYRQRSQHEAMEGYVDERNDEECIEDLEDDLEHALTRVASHFESIEVFGKSAWTHTVSQGQKCIQSYS